MKVVVTGAQGFVGRHLVAHLCGRGVEVVGLDCAPAGERAPQGASFLTCDIRDPESYRAALEGADVLVHLASAHLQVGLPESVYWSVNVASLLPLLETARDAGVRHFVHTSSVGVHGSVATIPADEDAAIAPENVYEKTKAAGETEVRNFLPQARAMGVTIVRPAWIYGRGDSRTEKILRAIARGRFVLFGSGSNYRHPIHVSDYLAGMDRLLLQPQTYGRTYILAGASYLTARELLAAAERVTGGQIRLRLPMGAGRAVGFAAETAGRLLRTAPPMSRRTLAFFANQNAFDIRRARAEFGFSPALELEDGFAQVWAAMREGS